ncbi:MAG TPA: hypothetical protein VJ824_16885 [Bacillota bacterium]|nr:hypothetical protein [Bacillota bacterium]
MDWEIYHIIEQAEIVENIEGEVALVCNVYASKEHFQKLLDGATQATLDFAGGEVEGKSLFAFHLQNANGHFYLALTKKDWTLLLEAPDQVVFQYGTGEKERFETTFLNWMFENFLDGIIEEYNKGAKNPFTLDVIEVFADEDEA